MNEWHFSLWGKELRRAGRPSSISGVGNVWETGSCGKRGRESQRRYVFYLVGEPTQEIDRDGRVRDFTYDDLNRQTAEKWMDGSTVLETFSYSYNADGQLTSASNPDSAYAYAYDGQGRVTSVDNNGTPNVPDVVLSDQYDANSNRTQLSATIAGTADFQNVYTYDALDRLTQLYQQGQTGGNAVATKGANLTYNLLGQLATIARTNFFGIGPAPDIATSTFSYDTANRLTEIAYTDQWRHGDRCLFLGL